jgi:hypothetical protein
MPIMLVLFMLVPALIIALGARLVLRQRRVAGSGPT